MEAAEEKMFREFIAGQGLKCTPERQLILREVFSIHQHFEADDIADGLRRRGMRVSRASIYRTLPLLVESGLLREVHSSEKHSHYEHVFGHKHHDHMICTRCGRTIEFTDERIEGLQNRVCERHGFLSTAHTLEIVGICKECREKQPGLPDQG